MSQCTTPVPNGNGTVICSGSAPKSCELELPCKEKTGWRRVVRNFTPSWFSVCMGTGMVSVLLHNLPYNAPWLQYLSYIVFGLNVFLFIVFLGISIARYTLYPEIWTAMIAHPAQSLFLGCFPMALATIVNMMVLCCTQWCDEMIYVAWAFWWVDIWLSIATCISMPFIVMHRHRPGLENITAALLLPIVPTIVAAGTGGIVAEALPNPHHAFTTIIVSYVSWGIGSSFTACVLALYFHRLTIHSIPSKEAVVSSLLPVGPMGQGAFAIQQLGNVALHVIPKTNAFGEVGARAGEVLHVMGVFVGLVMYGFGLIWLSFALISIITTRPRFNMGYWGFTFPLGTLATSANNLAGTLDSDFFRVATMVVSLAVMFLWMVVATKTATVAISGELFHAPCLKDVQEKSQARESGKVV